MKEQLDTSGNYIQNQFCSYEIALKLKELGFDEISRFGQETSLYTKEGKHTFYANYGFMGSGLSGDYIYAPLWQQVIDWIEAKGYYINITRVFQWSPLPIKFSGWCIHIGTENPEEELACNSYYIDHYYSTRKEAIKQAILKAIELCQKEK